MDSQQNVSRGRMPVSARLTAARKQKKGRKWGAGVIAAVIAMAWTVGGLVLPSMADTGNAMASVKPTVTVNGNQPVNVQAVGTNENPYVVTALNLKGLKSFTDQQQAHNYYGTTGTFGSYGIQYLPAACVVRPGTILPGLHDSVQFDYGRNSTPTKKPIVNGKWPKPFGVWVLTPGASNGFGNNSATTRSANPDSDTLTINGDTLSADDSGSTLSRVVPSSTNDATGSAVKQDTAPLENTTPSVSNEEGPIAAPGEEGTEVTPSPTPSVSEEADEEGAIAGTERSLPFWSWVYYTQSSSVYKKVSTFTVNPGESETDATGRLNALIDEMAEDARVTLLKQASDWGLPATHPSVTAALKDLEAQIAQTRVDALKQLKNQLNGLSNKVFKPSFEIEVSYNPGKDKKIALEELQTQLNNAWNKTLAELDTFAIQHGLTDAKKKEIRDNLKTQFDKISNDARNWLEKRYSGGGMIGYDINDDKNCYQSGPLVPDGSIVLVKTPARGGLDTDNVWFLGKVTNGNNAISYVPQYADDDLKARLKADNVPSFCVEPFVHTNGGWYKPGTQYTGTEWANNNPELAETVKAIVWHYFKHNQAEYGAHQNAIWMTVIGLMDGVGLWKFDSGWVGNSNKPKEIISEAISEYKNRTDVVKALETMHLDQISAEVSADKSYSLLKLKLNDYISDSAVRREIGDKIYLSVSGATDEHDNPVSKITLTEAEQGVTLKVKDQKNFSIKFEGSIQDYVDAYFLDLPGSQAQVTVLRKDISVSGGLTVKWGETVTPQPKIGTTASVEGAPEAAPEILPYLKGKKYTLKDSITYENLDPNQPNGYRIHGTLVRQRGSNTEDVDSQYIFTTSNVNLQTPNGTWQDVFKSEVSDIREGDHFYFKEELQAMDSSGNWSTIYRHPDLNNPVEMAGQSILIGKPDYGKLTAKKVVREGADLVKDAEVTISVTCGDDKYQFFAPAKGGAATRATKNGKADGTNGVVDVAVGTTCQGMSEDQMNSTTVNMQQQGVVLDGNTNGSFVIESKDQVYTISAFNSYSKKTGSFQVIKKIGGDLNANEAAANNMQFRFEYTCSDPQEAAAPKATGSFDINAAKNWSHTENGIPNGYVCSITETDVANAPAGFKKDLQVLWEANNGTEGVTVKDFTVNADSTTVRTVTNTYQRENVSFSLKKIESTSDGKKLNGSYNFQVVCKQDGSNLTWEGPVEAGKAVSFDQIMDTKLVAGTVCTVTEDVPDANQSYKWDSVGFNVDGADKTGSSDRSISFKLPNSSATAVTVTATNRFTAKKGTLELTKQAKIVSGTKDFMKDTTYSFSAECKVGDTIKTEAPLVKAGGTYKFVREYPVGTECAIWEKDINDNQISNEVTWSGGNGKWKSDYLRSDGTGTGAYVVTIPVNNEDKPVVKITASNSLKQLMGRVKVLKETTGGAEGDNQVPSKFEFNLSCPAFSSETFKTTVAHKGESEFNVDIPVGTKCIVTETKNELTGIRWTNSLNGEGNGNSVEVTIPSQVDGNVQAVTVNAKNNLEYKKATLLIKKVATGGGGEFAEPSFNQPFKFTYTCTANGKTYTQDKPFEGVAAPYLLVYANSVNPAQVSVPAGANCTVTESSDFPPVILDGTKDPIKYNGVTQMSLNGGAPVDGKTIEITEIAENATVTATATNYYVGETTGFTFSKRSVMGNNAKYHQNDDFTFHWLCTSKSGSNKGEVTLKAGQSHTVPNVPAGRECALWETTNSTLTGPETHKLNWYGQGVTNDESYKVGDATYHAAKFTVKSGQNVVVNLDNTYDTPTTSLTVDKKLVLQGEHIAVDKNKEFGITVRCTYKDDTPMVRALKLTDSSDPVVIDNLKIGSICTITEVNENVANHIWTAELTANGATVDDFKAYGVSGHEASVNIGSKDPVNVVVTNTYKRDLGKFVISKEVTGDTDIETKPTYKFDYTCKAPKGETGEVKGRGIQVGNGETKTVQNIPLGYTCEVTEQETEYDGDVLSKGMTVNGQVGNSFTLTPKVTAVKVHATNTFSNTMGQFEVKKVAKSSDTLPSGIKFPFTWQCVPPTGQSGSPVDGSFTLVNGGVFTSQKIPTGFICEITEGDALDADNTVIPGYKSEVSWDFNGGNSVPSATANNTPSFGKDGTATAKKFQIGKHLSTVKLTATNQVAKKEVKLQLVKTNVLPEGIAQNDVMSNDYVFLNVTCGTFSKDIKVIPGAAPVTLGQTVKYGEHCTVSELSKEFKDGDVFAKKGLTHKLDLKVTDANGQQLADPISYVFDPVNPAEKSDEIGFDANTEATITVAAVNTWSKYQVNTTIGAANRNGDPVEGVKTIKLPSDGTQTVELTDTVSYTDLPEGEYTIKGRLFSVKNVPTSIGQGALEGITYPKDTTIQGGPGTKTVTLNYTVPVSVFEKYPDGIGAGVVIYDGTKAIASELTLPAQQQIKPLWTPAIKTQAQQANNKSNVLNLGANISGQKVTDTVTYTNVPKGKYDFYARLVSAEDPTLKIGEGTQTIELESDEANGLASGSVTNESIVVDQIALTKAVAAGKSKFVIYEYLLPAGQGENAKGIELDQVDAKAVVVNGVPLKHTDANDLRQQLFTPTARTTATIGSADGTKVVDPSMKDVSVTVVDRVNYTNLIGGRTYKVNGTLHIKNADGTDGGTLKDGNGKEITAEKEFKAPGDAGKLVSGSVVLTFEVPAKLLKSQTVVAFEEVKDGDLTVVTHADISDEDQTVYSPELKTTAGVMGSEVTQTVQMGDKKQGTATITDKVSYKALKPGTQYTVVGQLMRLKVDDRGTRSLANDTPVATATESFTATTQNGNLDLAFTGVKVTAGSSYVVFETLYEGNVKVVGGKVVTSNGGEAKPVAQHKDPTDEAQAVYAPKVTTDAKEGDDKYFNPNQVIQITDVATYSGLIPGKKYEITGTLHIKNADGTDGGVVTKGGTELSVNKTFQASATGSGTVEILFEIPAKDAQDQGLLGKSIVAFEKVTQDGKEVATHTDIKDGDQTVYSGDMGTTAVDKADGNKTVRVGQTKVEITDTVSFSGTLDKGDYTLVGVLHYTDGTNDLGVVPGASATHVTFTLDKPGVPETKTMDFSVPTKSIVVEKNSDGTSKVKNFVVYEYLYAGKNPGKTTAGDGSNPADPKPGDKTPIISHENPGDGDQTITITDSEVTTDAYDGGSKEKKDKNLDGTKEKVNVYDLVTYKGLEVGKEYEIEGRLYYQDGSDAGTEVPTDQYRVGFAKDSDTALHNAPARLKFTADKVDGTVLLRFEVDKAALTTTPMVVFEDVWEGNVKVASHHDIKDGRQTVYTPSIGTTATVGENAKSVSVDPDPKKQQKELQVKDVVKWTNLADGDYTMYGRLFVVDNNGKVVGTDPVAKASQDFSVKGTHDSETALTFTVPANKVKAGVKFVAFERLVPKGGSENDDKVVIAKHEDPTDPAQTVTVKSIDTTLVDGADGDHVVDVTTTGKATVIDRVDYTGLDPKKKYTVTGELMVKSTGESTGLTKTVEIGPGTQYEIDASGSGSVEIPFEVEKQWVGEKIVAFESVKEYGQTQDYLIHHDINDDDQTVTLPGVKTSATVTGERKLVVLDKDSTVIDSVELTGLNKGQKYVVTGELMNKQTGEATGIKGASKVFTAEGKAAKVEVQFKVPAGTLKAESDQLVVFEKLWVADQVTVKDGVAIPKTSKDGKTYQPAGTHQDLGDVSQTVGAGVSPKIGTILSVDGSRELGQPVPVVGTDTTQLTDKVLYEGLTPKVKYTLTAELMEINLADGKVKAEPVAVGTTELTPEESAGVTTVPINLGSFKLKPGYKYVAYETLTRDNPEKPGTQVEVTNHKDPKDNNQTVQSEYNPNIGTTLSTDGKREAGTTAPLVAWDGKSDLSFIDTVKYTGLKPGIKYVVQGALKKVENGQAVADANATMVAAQFTPEKPNGTTQVKFTIKADELKALLPANDGQVSVVAYEKLWEADQVTVSGDGSTVTPKAGQNPVAKHEESTDEAQTVIVTKEPAIGTTLENTEGKDKKSVSEAGTVSLTDTVKYYNLAPNTDYVVTGELMGIANGQTDPSSATATGVVAKAKLHTPAAKPGQSLVSGDVKVTFEVPLEVLKANSKLVAFEKLFIDADKNGNPDDPNTPVTTHEEPNDPNQTVEVKHPTVGTSAQVGEFKTISTWEGENAEGKPAEKAYTLVDTVKYTGLEVGKTYALSGQVYLKEPNKEAKVLYRAVTTFSPKEADGTTTMEFKVQRADLVSGKSELVVFEQLWAPGDFETPAPGDTKITPTKDKNGKDNVPVAEHNKLESTSQAITVDKPSFGQLTITKKVEGWNKDKQNPSVTEATAKYDFTVTCGDKVTKFTVNKDQANTINGIPLGTTCIIEEDTQLAESQANLKDALKFTTEDGIDLTEVKDKDGKVRDDAIAVKIGDTADGTTTVPVVKLTAINHFVPEPNIGTNTQSMDGKVVTNGGRFTDNVKYTNMPAGNYLVHTYFMEMVNDQPTKINYVESFLTAVNVEANDKFGNATDGYNGSWPIAITVPSDLAEKNKQLVTWEDVYQVTKDLSAEKIQEDLAAGKNPKPYVYHHEVTKERGDGYQWFEVNSNYGGFQVSKEMVTEGLPENVAKAVPNTFNFSWKAELPAGGKVQDGTPLEGTFQLTVDPNDPTKAISQKFEGYPMDTVVTITETGVDGTLPTGAAMSTTWKVGQGQWSDGKVSDTIKVKIGANAEAQIVAKNTFTDTKPTLQTQATTLDGGKQLTPTEDTKVLDTVTYSGLVEGRQYWLKTALVYVDTDDQGKALPLDQAKNQPVLGADGQPLVKWTKVKAGADNSKWVVDQNEPLVVPASADPERDVVFFEYLYEIPDGPGTNPGDTPKPGDGDKPVAKHEDPNDPAQTLTRRPKLNMGTVADVEDVEKITIGTAAVVVDKVTYNGLKPSQTYTLVGQLVKKSDGTPVGDKVTAIVKAQANGSGTWEMKLPVSAADMTAAKLTKNDSLVVFERAYIGEQPNAGADPSLKPILSHEDRDSAPQTVLVKEPEDTPPPYTPPNPSTPPTSPATTVPSTPPSTPPVSPDTTTPVPPLPPVSPAITVPPLSPKTPPLLARTGAQALTVGLLAIAMIAGGAVMGLYAGRRKRESEQD